VQKKKRKERATRRRENANNKWRTAVGERGRKLHPTKDRRERTIV